MTGSGKKWVTSDDLKASFNLFCCVYGIGTLGMPGNFARAGPVFATIALLFMASANVFASCVVSKTFLVAPKSVRTFGDLGQWAFGTGGRWAVNISQMGVCLLVPCAFLVLGSSLLETLFPDALSPYAWIVLMAISLMPYCLTPTLKETAGAALAGAVGTLLADFIALGVLIYYLSPLEAPRPDPPLKFSQIVQTFGNLSLAYGAAIVIPAIQRQHSEPSRVPRVIFGTLTLVSILFLVISVTGYVFVGCQIPGNLLFAIAGTSLGFTASRGSVVLAFLMMQLHITIAFAVILHPAFFLAERALLGVHSPPPTHFDAHEDNIAGADAEAGAPAGVCGSPDARMSSTATPSAIMFKDINSPLAGELLSTTASGSQIYHRRQQVNSVASMADICKEDLDEQEEANVYKDKKSMTKIIILRVVMISALVALACLLKNHFLDLQDFIGASCVSVCCLILPCLFYLKIFGRSMPIYEKIYSWIVVLVCAAAGGYATYNAGVNLFAPVSGPPFPFCAAGDYQYYPYTNATAFPY